MYAMATLLFEIKEPSKTSRKLYVYCCEMNAESSVWPNSLNVFDKVRSWKPEFFFFLHNSFYREDVEWKHWKPPHEKTSDKLRNDRMIDWWYIVCWTLRKSLLPAGTNWYTTAPHSHIWYATSESIFAYAVLAPFRVYFTRFQKINHFIRNIII